MIEIRFDDYRKPVPFLKEIEYFDKETALFLESIFENVEDYGTGIVVRFFVGRIEIVFENDLASA